MTKNDRIFLMIVLLGIVSFLPACRDLDLGVDIPLCIENKINEIKKEQPRNPPAQVWKWEVDGTIYYYVTSDCCDQYNYLYDEDCKVICAPDGGFSGSGDGSCPDFNGEIKYTLVWKDERE